MDRPRFAYDFAVLRLVPHPHLEQWTPIGIVLHSRTEEFLAARVVLDRETLHSLAPELDVTLLHRYLTNWLAIAEGDAEAGAVAHHPPSERFHWLTSPRSDVLQASPVRRGVATDLDVTLNRLWTEHVAR